MGHSTVEVVELPVAQVVGVYKIPAPATLLKGTTVACMALEATAAAAAGVL